MWASKWRQQCKAVYTTWQAAVRRHANSRNSAVSRHLPYSSNASSSSEALKPEELPKWQWKTYHMAAPAALALGVAAAAAGLAGQQFDGGEAASVVGEDEAMLVNWSGTHECSTQRLLQPHTLEELEGMVAEAHQTGKKLRCVGSALSPNGIGFQPEGMVSLALMDKILTVDPKTKLVTVQAGARVQEVADQLRRYGLTLQNYASIREQTIGGFTQVSAHGTGAAIPPVDDSVVEMKLVTPALGTLELSKERDPELFYLARCGVGCLGVVAEVTLQAVTAHKLMEHTFTTNTKTVRRNHSKWLRNHQHLRYMWIPLTDTVVVVTNDPVQEDAVAPPDSSHSESDQLQPFRQLARQTGKFTEEELAVMSATELRDSLLSMHPLDTAWVKQVNQAESLHWQRREGYRVGWSDQLLGFDCGGQQWVLEVCFPTGTISRPSGADLKFMEELHQLIVSTGIPAHPPIEQRWTCGSGSSFSPAHGPPDSLHSWVGIIMYLPQDEQLRQQVTHRFKQYGGAVTTQLLGKYNGAEHWAKIELPEDEGERLMMKNRIQSRYPVAALAEARARLDPKNILGNKLVDELLTPSV